jgi:hypothetical protein
VQVVLIPKGGSIAPLAIDCALWFCDATAPHFFAALARQAKEKAITISLIAFVPSDAPPSDGRGPAKSVACVGLDDRERARPAIAAVVKVLSCKAMRFPAGDERSRAAAELAKVIVASAFAQPPE